VDARSGPRVRILSLLLGGRATDIDVERLCEVCVEVTGTRGAAITLMSGRRAELRSSVCTTNKVSAQIEQLQYTLGEGPSLDAYNQRRPILESDLPHPSMYRWPVFSAKAVSKGVRSVFAFPLQTGTERLGVLTLCSGQPGRLAHDDYLNAIVMAEVVAQTVLVLQSGALAERLAPELEAVTDSQGAVDQASGMVSAQLGINIPQALGRLRTYAFGTDRLLVEVANDVVGRKLRFDAPFGEASQL
jgi:transcriptional regulator with GAF, ATPase, and Fis domain